MIKCPAPYFDSGQQMVKQIFKAYTNTKSHRFAFDASHDLPQEVNLVISESKQAAYIAWKFNHCIALEIVSKNESENEDKYEQHFDVIVPCENNYLSDAECKKWLGSVSDKAITSIKEKMLMGVSSRLETHLEVHTVYPNSVVSFSESKTEKATLDNNRKAVFEWVERYLPMCLILRTCAVH